MRRLVSRYIHQLKKQMRQDGVNEDDLLEIKQDISSLRLPFRFIHLPDRPKNEATLHFAEYLENYQRYLHDFLHTSRLVYTEYVCSLQV